MTLESPRDARLYRRYVHPLGPSAAPPRQYSSALRRFERFVATPSPPDALSQATLVAWLQAMRVALPLERTLDYARKLDSFFSWRVDRGQLAMNPWADLRARYGQHRAPIVRARLAPNPTDRLNALRPLPAFGSHLGPAMQHSLAYKPALGLRYERETTRVRSCDR